MGMPTDILDPSAAYGFEIFRKDGAPFVIIL
jgi:hypothetical protein